MDASLADLDRVVRADPSDAGARVRLLVALLRAGRVVDAWQAVREGLAVAPDDRVLVGFHDDVVDLTRVFALGRHRFFANASIGSHHLSDLLVPGAPAQVGVVARTPDAGLVVRASPGERLLVDGQEVREERQVRDGAVVALGQGGESWRLTLDPARLDAAALLERLERRAAQVGACFAWELLEGGRVVGAARLEGRALSFDASVQVEARARAAIPSGSLTLDARLWLVDRALTHGLRVMSGGALEGRRVGAVPWVATRPERRAWFPEPTTVEAIIDMTASEELPWHASGDTMLFSLGALGGTLMLSHVRRPAIFDMTSFERWVLQASSDTSGLATIASEEVATPGPLARLVELARARAERR
jgi:hypothetical protein